ncbi:HERV-H LTR-associating protein 1 homolog [Spinachia spinachia]
MSFTTAGLSVLRRGDVMADTQRAARRPGLRPTMAVCTAALLVLFSQALRDGRRHERHRRDVLDSTGIPAQHIDPAAIDLTPLVNTLVNTSQSGSRQLFSLLSVTSYSSLALHKLTLLVYNISSIRSLESNTFRRRFCYCVTNDTNDLTGELTSGTCDLTPFRVSVPLPPADFTAILLDVMGNSTSYLQELFKSASILSVSQKNQSDCIYICVMAGKTGE